MYFKRPSFKRGGSTGIGQLTPRVKAQGGYFGQTPIYPIPLNQIRASAAMGMGSGIVPMMKSFPMDAQVMGASSTIVPTKNKINYGMQGLDYGVGGDPINVDTAFTPEEIFAAMYERVTTKAKEGKYLNKEERKFAKDNNIKMYRDLMGGQTQISLEDIVNKNKTGIDTIGADGDQITVATDAEKAARTKALLEGVEEDIKIIEPGSDDSSITLDPYAEIKKEKDFLSEMLKNEGLERGEIALIAARAIGEEGSFKDKLDKAVELALPVVRRRNKEDKALTLTAYKSFKEKEKAQAKATADASKPTVGMKELQYQANMILKSGDKSRGDTQDEVITSLISEKFKSPDQTLRRETLVRAQEKVFESFDDLKDSKKAYDDYVKTKYLDKEKEIDVTDKKLINLQRQIDENLNIFKLFYDVPEFSEQYPAYVDAFNRLGLKEGGRVKRSLGSPDTGEQIITSETETIGAETAQKPVLKLTYDDLRNRLPQEITDDVVELLANSEEALQDFAYIQTQNDVDSFNIKYGVNLIIPPAPQTA